MIRRYKKLTLLILLIPLSCSADSPDSVDTKTVSVIITHYFTSQARISFDAQPNYVTGDFNGDGNSDLAVLFYPQKKIEASKQVHVSKPWVFPGSVQSKAYSKSLAIINGSSNGWMSSGAKVYALLDYSGVLVTPSFQLIYKNNTEKDYAQRKAMLPTQNNADLLILPTEAGVDTYIYWDGNSYKLFVPEEMP